MMKALCMRTKVDSLTIEAVFARDDDGCGRGNQLMTANLEYGKFNIASWRW